MIQIKKTEFIEKGQFQKILGLNMGEGWKTCKKTLFPILQF
jgi:hypothetical protein